MDNMDVIDNNTFEENTFQLKTLGEFLRFHREQKHFSLEELSFKTKIRIHQLMYLEENDFIKLPNKIYLRGFIKSICNELEINAEIALSYLNDIDFKEEAYEFLTPIAPIIPRATQKDSPRVSYREREEMSSPYYGPRYFDASKVNQKLVLGGTVLLLLSVTVIGTFRFKTNRVAEQSTHKKMSYFEAKRLQAGEAVTNLAPPASEAAPVVVATTQTQAQAIAQTAPTTEVAAKAGSPALVAPKQQVQAVQPVQPVQVAQGVQVAQPAPAVQQVQAAPVAKPVLAATALPKTVAVVPKPVTPALAPIVETEATQTAAVEESLKINITAKKGDVFVVYRIDGEKKLRALIKKGKSMSLEGNNIRMNVGNPDAVEIIKNGETVVVKPEAGKGSAHLKFSVKK